MRGRVREGATQRRPNGATRGIEEQTRKLFEVCWLRDVPIITFVNKLDREGRDPFDLLDEIEQSLALDVTPASWPIGIGRDFLGTYNCSPLGALHIILCRVPDAWPLPSLCWHGFPATRRSSEERLMLNFSPRRIITSLDALVTPMSQVRPLCILITIIFTGCSGRWQIYEAEFVNNGVTNKEPILVDTVSGTSYAPQYNVTVGSWHRLERSDN